MSSNRNTLTKLAAATLLFAGVPIGAAAEDWDWSLAPYAWLPAIGSNISIDVPPIDLGGTSQTGLGILPTRSETASICAGPPAPVSSARRS